MKRDFTASARTNSGASAGHHLRADVGWLSVPGGRAPTRRSRKVVGWAMSTTLHTDVVLDALNMAVTQREAHATSSIIRITAKPIHVISLRSPLQRRRAFARRWGTIERRIR